MEEFLEDINNILNSGEVPNLFDAEELERVIIGCRPAAKEVGIAEGNREGIYDFFINRVRSVTGAADYRITESNRRSLSLPWIPIQFRCNGSWK